MKITFGYNAATCKLMSACHMIFRSSAQSHWLLNIDSKDNFFKEQFRMRQVWLGAAVSMMTHKITASAGHNILIPVSFSPRTMRLRCVRSTHNRSLCVIVLPALSTSKPFTQETKNKIVLAALPEPINMMYTRPLVLCGTSDRGRDVEHQARPLGSWIAGVDSAASSLRQLSEKQALRDFRGTQWICTANQSWKS